MRKALGIATCVACAWIVLTVMSSAVQAQTSSAKASKPPASIAEVGELGENIYDLVKDQQWTKAADKLASLKKDASTLRSQVKDADEAKQELSKAIAALEKSIAAKDRQATMPEANRITLIAANLTEPFHPQVPVDVTRLDYYGRELETWSVTKNEAKLKGAADALGKTWARVRPVVQEYGGTSQVKTFDDLIVRLKAANSPEQYAQIATPILDEVDNLEKVFTK